MVLIVFLWGVFASTTTETSGQAITRGQPHYGTADRNGWMEKWRFTLTE